MSEAASPRAAGPATAAEGAAEIVVLSGVTKRFGAFTAVADFSLTLRRGEFFSLLGPSGCGKTTALRMIAGFLEPDAGEIRIDGQPMRGVPANRRPTNMVFQNYAIFPHLDVAANVGFGLARLGLSRAEARARVAEALAMVELSGLERRRPDALSGGQRQRVALARALVMRPKVLLLDEPLSALDKNLREAMQLELRRLQQRLGITFVMVTHDQYEAMTMSDRIGVMFDGRLVQVDRPEEIYAWPASRAVAGFIGAMNFLPARCLSVRADTVEADIAPFGPLPVPANPNVPPPAEGEALLVGIRPEQLAIGRGRSAGCDAWAVATVRDAAFYGANIYYHLRAEAADLPLTVAVPNRTNLIEHGPGERVWVGARAAAVVALGPAGACAPTSIHQADREDTGDA